LSECFAMSLLPNTRGFLARKMTGLIPWPKTNYNADPIDLAYIILEYVLTDTKTTFDVETGTEINTPDNTELVGMSRMNEIDLRTYITNNPLVWIRNSCSALFVIGFVRQRIDYQMYLNEIFEKSNDRDVISFEEKDAEAICKLATTSGYEISLTKLLVSEFFLDAFFARDVNPADHRDYKRVSIADDVFDVARRKFSKKVNWQRVISKLISHFNDDVSVYRWAPFRIPSNETIASFVLQKIKEIVKISNTSLYDEEGIFNDHMIELVKETFLFSVWHKHEHKEEVKYSQFFEFACDLLENVKNAELRRCKEIIQVKQAFFKHYSTQQKVYHYLVDLWNEYDNNPASIKQFFSGLWHQGRIFKIDKGVLKLNYNLNDLRLELNYPTLKTKVMKKHIEEQVEQFCYDHDIERNSNSTSSSSLSPARSVQNQRRIDELLMAPRRERRFHPYSHSENPSLT